MEILLLLFLLSLILFLSYLMLSFFTGAPFVVTPMAIINEILTITGISSKDTVADLGSGDGRILIAAAKKGADTQGWEINPFLVLWTKAMAYTHAVAKTVHVYNKPYQNANLQTASVVIFYNIPGHLPKLEKKLHKELKKGTKVVSYKFPLKTFKQIKQTKSGIYLYIKS